MERPLYEGTVLSLQQAARHLPMRDKDALKWLRDRNLVRDLDGRRVIIWGDVLECLRGTTDAADTPTPPTPPRAAKPAAIPRYPL